MQIQHIGYRFGKLYSVVNYGYRCMNFSEEVKLRLRALEFWDKHGLNATMDAFNVSRRTLFTWKQAYKHNGTQGLVPKHKAPKSPRSRSWPIAVINKIRAFRVQLPNLGKEQLHVKLIPWCAKKRIALPEYLNDRTSD